MINRSLHILTRAAKGLKKWNLIAPWTLVLNTYHFAILYIFVLLKNNMYIYRYLDFFPDVPTFILYYKDYMKMTENIVAEAVGAATDRPFRTRLR